MTMTMFAFRSATMTAVAVLLVGCSGGGLKEGVSTDAPSLKGPVEGTSKEMQTLLKAKPKQQSAVKAL